MDLNSPRSRKRGQLQSWPLIRCFLARRKIPLLRSPPYGSSPPWSPTPQIQPMSPSEGYKPKKCIDTISTSFFVVVFWNFFHLSFWIIFWNWPDAVLSAFTVGRTISKIVGYYLYLNLHIQQTWTWTWTYILKRDFIIIKQWSLIVPDNCSLWFSFRPGNLI